MADVLNKVGLGDEDIKAVANAEAKIESVFKEATINIIIEGGSATASAGMMSADDFIRFWCAGFESKELEYAVPVSYQLKNLVDNKVIESKPLSTDNVVSKNSLIDLELKDVKLENDKNPFTNIKSKEYIINFDAIGTVITPIKKDSIRFNNDLISGNINQVLLTDVGIDSRLIMRITDTEGNNVDFEISDKDKEKLMLKKIPIGLSELSINVKTSSGMATLSFNINCQSLVKK